MCSLAQYCVPLNSLSLTCLRPLGENLLTFQIQCFIYRLAFCYKSKFLVRSFLFFYVCFSLVRLCNIPRCT